MAYHNVLREGGAQYSVEGIKQLQSPHNLAKLIEAAILDDTFACVPQLEMNCFQLRRFRFYGLGSPKGVCRGVPVVVAAHAAVAPAAAVAVG